jgi:hypothetical protein
MQTRDMIGEPDSTCDDIAITSIAIVLYISQLEAVTESFTFQLYE